MTERTAQQFVEDIDDVAGFWLVRLESPDCTPQDRVAFEKWKRESPLHEQAYENLRAGNSVMDQLLDAPDLLAMAEAARLETEPPFWRQTSFRVPAIAASLILAVGLPAAFVMNGLSPDEPILADAGVKAYETAIGELSTVYLADGTEVKLNTDTRIEVRFSAEERLVDLTRGQGYFTVAKDPLRPFVVEAGDRRVIALGTEFDVRYRTESQVEVTLVEGLVNVDLVPVDLLDNAPNHEESVETVSLQPGERLAASPTRTPTITKPNVIEETSWTYGKLVFRDRALSDVVRELNRYSIQKIALSDDPRLDALVVSGVFKSGRASTFVTALEAMHPLKAERTGRNEVTLIWAR